jgi:hypothetical protein
MQNQEQGTNTAPGSAPRQSIFYTGTGFSLSIFGFPLSTIIPPISIFITVQWPHMIYLHIKFYNSSLVITDEHKRKYSCLPVVMLCYIPFKCYFKRHYKYFKNLSPWKMSSMYVKWHYMQDTERSPMDQFCQHLFLVAMLHNPVHFPTLPSCHLNILFTQILVVMITS